MRRGPGDHAGEDVLIRMAAVSLVTATMLVLLPRGHADTTDADYKRAHRAAVKYRHRAEDLQHRLTRRVRRATSAGHFSTDPQALKRSGSPRSHTRSATSSSTGSRAAKALAATG